LHSGANLRRDVGSNRQRELAQLLRARLAAGDREREPQRRPRVCRAPAQSGGDRDSLVDRDLQRRQVRSEALAKAGERDRREVRLGDAGADHDVDGAARLLGDDDVGKRDRAEERADLVQAVLTSGPDVEEEVQLRGRERPQR